MHEEMHMTQMQFMNAGAQEIVSFLDTMSWGSKVPNVCIQEGDTDPPLVCPREGIKTEPTHDAHAKGTIRGCT